MAEDAVRILHLSDFHFAEGQEKQSRPLLARLAGEIGAFVANGQAPDLVAITGDIARSGTKAEYALARGWINDHLLPALPEGFPKDRILLVPGNHDVDRSAVKAAQRGLQDHLLGKPLPADPQERIGEVLEDADDRAVLLKRHDAYLDFANGYRLGKKKLDVPWWSQVREINGCRLHIAGLCSSWMACSDEDRGRLLIGRHQIEDLFYDAPQDEWHCRAFWGVSARFHLAAR